jgi:hypothetical protein
MFNLKNKALIKYSVKNFIMHKVPPMKSVNLEQNVNKRDPSSKGTINPADIDDYIIVGAEIFKNSLKDLVADMNNGGENIDSIVKEIQSSEQYGPVKEPYSIPEPHKYIKNYTGRPFYQQSDPEHKHIYEQSYREKPEPLNTIPLFKFSYINNNRDDHNEIIFKKNAFVPGFNRPFNLGFQELENTLKAFKTIRDKDNIDFNSKDFHMIIDDNYNDPNKSKIDYVREYMKVVQRVLDLLPQINHKNLPNLLMTLFFDYGVNDKRLWVAIEQEIMNKLHHYDIIDLSKIYYISYMSSPKFSTINFRQQIYQKVYGELNNCSLEELYAVCLGFRMCKEKNIYKRIAEIFIEKRMLFARDQPSNISKIFYSYASNKPTNYTIDTFYPHKDLVEKFIKSYEHDLLDNILKMDQNDVSRLCTSLYLLKSDHVDLFINRVERNLLKLKENIDPFVLWTVLKSFSKMKESKMVGSDRFFDELEPVVISFIETDKYNMDQFSDILYSYSIRGSGSEKLNKLFDTKVNNDMDKVSNYRTMYNVLWYLLFTENKNEQTWLKLLDKYNQIEGKLPLVYYRPFKLAAYYLKYLFPHINTFEFTDKFYYAEQLYDYVKYEKLFFNHYEYLTFKTHLNTRHYIYPLCNFVIHNAMMLNFCFEPRKMGINLILDHQLVPKTTRPNKMHCVHKTILQHDNWEILELTWHDYFKIGDQDQRDKFIHNWFYETSIKQEKKGIFKMNPKYV